MKYLIIASLIFGCSSGNIQKPTPPPQINHCSLACNHLRDLGCREAETLIMPNGLQCNQRGTCNNGVCSVWGFEGMYDICSETCEQFCEATQNDGVFLNPECVQKIKSCDEINTTCSVGKLRNQ